MLDLLPATINTIAWVTLGGVLIAVIVSTIVLFYHWNNYGEQSKKIDTIRIIYVIGTIALVVLMILLFIATLEPSTQSL